MWNSGTSGASVGSGDSVCSGDVVGVDVGSGVAVGVGDGVGDGVASGVSVGVGDVSCAVAAHVNVRSSVNVKSVSKVLFFVLFHLSFPLFFS